MTEREGRRRRRAIRRLHEIRKGTRISSARTYLWARRLFLVAGALPAVYLFRGLPSSPLVGLGALGVFAAAAILALVAQLHPTNRALMASFPATRRALLIAFAVALVAVALGVLGDFEVREGRPPIGDSVLRWTALAAQAVCMVIAVRTAHRSQEAGGSVAPGRVAFAFASVAVTAWIGSWVGGDLPSWAVYPLVGLVAARFAVVPIPDVDADGNPEIPSVAGEFALFTWTVVMLAVQARILGMPGGVAATAVAFGLGLVFLVLRNREAAGPMVKTAVVAAVGGTALLVGLHLALPSRIGAANLLDATLSVPRDFALRHSDERHGVFERWYETQRSRTSAVAALEKQVSPSGYDVEADETIGFAVVRSGWRVRVEAWDRRPGGARGSFPVRSHCAVEAGSCVRVSLMRNRRPALTARPPTPPGRGPSGRGPA